MKKNEAESAAFVVKNTPYIEFFEKDDVGDYNNEKPFIIKATESEAEHSVKQPVTIEAPCGEQQQFSRRDAENLALAVLEYLRLTS